MDGVGVWRGKVDGVLDRVLGAGPSPPELEMGIVVAVVRDPLEIETDKLGVEPEAPVTGRLWDLREFRWASLV